MLSAGVEYVLQSGTAIDTTLSSASQAVYSGGVASGTIVDGGFQDVSSGGIARGTAVNLGYQEVSAGGVVSDTIVSGFRNFVINYSGIQDLDGGFAIRTTVIAGGQEDIFSGGRASSTTIANGGTADVFNGGVARATTVSSGGHQFVYSLGVAIGTRIGSSGFDTVSSGGVASGSVILSGGFETISSGGTARGTTVRQGGSEVVSSGGAVIAATISVGGHLTAYNGASISGPTVDSGTLTFLSGAPGTATVTGSITGTGAVVVNGGNVALGSGTALTVARLALQSGTVSLGGDLAYAGSVTETSATVALAGHILTLAGPAVLRGNIVGPGTLRTRAATSAGGLTVSGGTWANSAVVTENGVLTLAGGARLANLSGAVFDLIAGRLDIGPGGGSLANLGLFEKTGGTGASTISATVANGGTVAANTGRLTFAGFQNNGSATVGTGATLEFAKSVSAAAGHSGTVAMATGGELVVDAGIAATQVVAFLNDSGDAGTLVLKSPGTFAASISGFTASGSQSDTIEIVGKTGLSASYSGDATSGTLTLSSGAITVGSLHFIGDYKLANFTFTGSGGNTFITDPNASAGASTPGVGTPDLAAVASAAGAHLTPLDLSHCAGTTWAVGGPAPVDPPGDIGALHVPSPRCVTSDAPSLGDHHH